MEETASEGVIKTIGDSSVNLIGYRMLRKAINETPYSELDWLSISFHPELFIIRHLRFLVVDLEAQARLGTGEEETVSAVCWLYWKGVQWQPFSVTLQIAGTARKFLFNRVWEREKGWRVDLTPDSI